MVFRSVFSAMAILALCAIVGSAGAQGSDSTRRSQLPDSTKRAQADSTRSAQADSAKSANGSASSNTGGRSVLQGVFTEEQAQRGDAEHQTNCESCHSTEKYTGEAFVKNWVGRTAFDLFDQLRTTMPDDNPGGLSAQQYTDIVAFIFKANGLPAGAAPLPADPEAMRSIRIELKPDSQLVRAARTRAVARAFPHSGRLRQHYFPHAQVQATATR